MPFKSTFNYKRFAERVIDQTRYRYSSEDEEFIRAVEEAGTRRTIVLPASTILYRARLKHGIDIVDYKGVHLELPKPVEPKEMKPLPKSAREGRVNPKGIPCLYLADNQKTAMSEVRPWIGAYVSIGKFVTHRNLRLMSCTTQAPDLWDQILRPTPDIEEAVWGEISQAFSEPVTDSDTKADYAPTQVLTEVFKRMGCDGIKYRSLLGEGGDSFALFDLNDASIVSCGLSTVEGIIYEFSKQESMYDVTADGSLTKHVRDAG